RESIGIYASYSRVRLFISTACSSLRGKIRQCEPHFAQHTEETHILTEVIEHGIDGQGHDYAIALRNQFVERIHCLVAVTHKGVPLGEAEVVSMTSQVH